MANDGSVRRVTLWPLIDLDTETQMKIREIRNEEGIRRWMYTDHIIDVAEHLAWVKALKTDSSQVVFGALDEERVPLGVVSVSRIDQRHKKAEWAYYLTETARGGLGSAIEFAFVEFVFGTLELEKLNCEVIEGNAPVVKIHKKFLFEEEGFRRSNIIKDGTRIGVHLLGLKREDWELGKAHLRGSFGRVLDKFEVAIHWDGLERVRELSPIDQIESARARNNLNWMSILRLALEKAPSAAKPIVSEIRKIDREISALTSQLTDDRVD